MDNDTDNAGLGLIVGILAVAVVLILALGIGPRVFRADQPDVNVTIEAPAARPAPEG
jgi:hypothetical protein